MSRQMNIAAGALAVPPGLDEQDRRRTTVMLIARPCVVQQIQATPLVNLDPDRPPIIARHGCWGPGGWSAGVAEWAKPSPLDRVSCLDSTRCVRRLLLATAAL